MATAWEVRSTGNANNGGGFVVGSSGTDYSQQDNPQWILTGLSNTGAVVTYSGATASMVGNWVKFTAGVTDRVYIVSVIVGVSFTVSTALTTGSGRACRIGGAVSTTDSTISSLSDIIYIKTGTSITPTVDILADKIIGYKTARTDRYAQCSGADRPYLAPTSVSVFFRIKTLCRNVRADASIPFSSGAVFLAYGHLKIQNCRIRNLYSSNATAINDSNTSTGNVITIEDHSEISCLRGTAINALVGGVYLRKSKITFSIYAIYCNGGFFDENVFLKIKKYGIQSNYPLHVSQNTFFGGNAFVLGDGIIYSSYPSQVQLQRNIIYGLNTATEFYSDPTIPNSFENNCFFNNTNVVAEQVANQLTYDPQFTNVSELNITGCTTTTGVIRKTAAFSSSSIIAGETILEVLSGTGVTLGYYLVTAKTNDALTVVPSITANATADKSILFTFDVDWTPRAELQALNVGGGYTYPAPASAGSKKFGYIN